MVSAATRCQLLASLALALTLSAPAKDLADYRLGDTVDEDIIAPAAMIVIDQDTTANLKQTAADKIPLVFRYDPETADAVENDFRAAFADARSNFVEVLSLQFTNRRLTERELGSLGYQRSLAKFQKLNPGFATATNLTALWAQGDSGRAVQASLVRDLRTVMERPIRTDTPIAGLKSDSPIRLLTATNHSDKPSWDNPQRRLALASSRSLLPLARARADFLESLTPEEQPLAPYAAGLLRPNCVLDATSTELKRAEAVDAIYAADRYEAGQTIARHGQVVDKKILAAVYQLKEKTVVGLLQQQAREQRAETEQMMKHSQRWLMGIAVGMALLALAIWRLARRTHRGSSLLPARVEPAGSGWQERALAAETREQKARAALREGVLPELTHFFKTKLVQKLVTQQSQLVNTQQTAAAEMAELEKRLDDIHAPLQERLKAYEQRISELEKSLVAKGEENRELLKAKIAMTRKQLAMERSRSDIELN